MMLKSQKIYWISIICDLCWSFCANTAENTPICIDLYISDSSIKSMSNFSKVLTREKLHSDQISRKWPISGRIGSLPRMFEWILTTNTIFQNRKSMPVQWIYPFLNLRISKIWVCKGPPFELWKRPKHCTNLGSSPHPFVVCVLVS